MRPGRASAALSTTHSHSLSAAAAAAAAAAAPCLRRYGNFSPPETHRRRRRRADLVLSLFHQHTQNCPTHLPPDENLSNSAARSDLSRLKFPPPYRLTSSAATSF